MNKPGLRAYLVEFLLFFSYALFAVNWIAGSTLTGSIMAFFGLTSFASATLISNAITLAKIVGNLMAAWFLVKLRPKWAVAFASGMIVLGALLAAFATQYWMFVLMRFVMGFGGALLVVYFAPFVVRYFEASQRPLMNGINASAYNIGGILAMIVVAPVIAWQQNSWQGTLIFFAGCSAVLLVLWLFIGEDFPLNQSANAAASSTPKKEYGFSDGLKDPFNYALPFTYSGLLLLYIVVLTILPISKISAIDPKNLSATVAFAGVVGAACGIFAVRKFARRLPIVRWSGLVMSAFGLLMVTASSGTVALAGAAGLGFMMFLPMTALLTIPQELPEMTPSRLTLMMGFFWSFSYIFETIAYYGVGLVIDAYGFKIGLYLSVALSLSFFIGSFLLPETGKKQRQEAK